MAADPSLVAARRALHGVAELVLAGPQYERSGSIELRVVADGFATVAPPHLRVPGAVVVAADLTVGIDGRTPRSLAADLGLEARPLDDVYAGGPGIDPDEVLLVDEASARRLLDALVVGDEALRALAPDERRVLWPEHFDVGITVTEVNYGVSPGDDHLPEPYAYVGPWAPPPVDGFWNQPFGRALPIAELGDAKAVAAFFAKARDRLGRAAP